MNRVLQNLLFSFRQAFNKLFSGAQTVDLEINTLDISAQEKFNVVEDTYNKEARAQKNAPYS